MKFSVFDVRKYVADVEGISLSPANIPNPYALEIEPYVDNDPIGGFFALITFEIDRPAFGFGSCPGAWCKSVALYAAPGG